jgi:hypothetical protein
MYYLDCCVGTCKPLYFAFPVDEAVALKHVRILYVTHDFQSFYVHLLVTVITCQNYAQSIQCQ